jgi:hypothetical protein
MRTLTKKLHAEVQSRLGALASETRFVPLGGIAKSGAVVSYLYRRENRIPGDRFLDSAGLAERGSRARGSVVLLDDLLASGHQAVFEWNRLQRLANIPASCRVLLATLVSCEAGMRYVEERTDLELSCTLKLTRANKPLDPSSDLSRTEEERAQVRHILKKYGEILAPRGPFGYAGSGLLFSSAHSTPDNSLPIFWATTGDWYPLITSGGSIRMGAGA